MLGDGSLSLSKFDITMDVYSVNKNFYVYLNSLLSQHKDK